MLPHGKHPEIALLVTPRVQQVRQWRLRTFPNTPSAPRIMLLKSLQQSILNRFGPRLPRNLVGNRDIFQSIYERNGKSGNHDVFQRL